MAYVELCLHLDCDLKRVAPEVRAWVDLDPEGHDTRETELALERRRAGSEWYGTFAVAEGGPRCVLYRLALVAHAGAEWSLSMYQRQRSRALLSDRDTLAMAKGWLVGTCELARDDRAAWRPRPAPSGRSFTRMRALPDAREPPAAATVVRLDRIPPP